MKVPLKAPTATENFSFTRNTLTQPAAKLIVLISASALMFTGCDTLKTRSEVQKPAPTTSTEAPPATTAEQPLPPQPVTPPPVQGPTLPQPSQGPVAPPTFLNRELPKVGLILGPGGMKTYAELGVLRELSRARIPVHAIAGLEWGAMMGALYSSQGQINDAEWKAFKLREQDIPSDSGFLSGRQRAQNISVMNEFLTNSFGSSSLEKGKVEFGCPAYWSRQQRFGWMSKGSAREAMFACMPYPPYFTANAGVYASPFAVEEAAQYLRSKGANLIILVNVLSAGDLLHPRQANESPSDQLLWSEIRREMARARSPMVHYTINVDTSGHPVTDFAARREMMEAGAKSSADTIRKISTQYGF